MACAMVEVEPRIPQRPPRPRRPSAPSAMSVFRNPTVAVESFSSSPFHTAGCSAANARVAAASFPVPMQ